MPICEKGASFCNMLSLDIKGREIKYMVFDGIAKT